MNRFMVPTNLYLTAVYFVDGKAKELRVLLDIPFRNVNSELVSLNEIASHIEMLVDVNQYPLH